MLRTRPARPLIPMLGLAVIVGLVGLVSTACSDHDRRLTEGEALQYKRELLRANPQAISPDQATDFGQHRGRTKAAIDRRFDELQREFDVEKAEARKTWEAERERVRRELDGGS